MNRFNFDLSEVEGASIEDCDSYAYNEVMLRLPKVELHAHLNGSLSKSTLNRLVNIHYRKPVSKHFFHSVSDFSSDSLPKCFVIFKLIHNICSTPFSIKTATEDVITDFFNDGVRYLELRSTPKEIPGSMTQSSYIEAMLSAIEQMKTSLPGIMVKLLLSINRESSVESAQEMLKIAESYFHSSSSTIVGIDLSGNPKTGNVEDFIPILQRAKQIGLKLALHMAEVTDTNDEVTKLLDLSPDRIGHGTYIHPSKGGCETNYNEIIRQKIPLEICLSSNIMSKTVSSYDDHHFPLWKEAGHPCVLCTDDKGIFDTSLSREYCLAKKYYSLTVEELQKMSLDSIEYSFASPEEKQQLRDLWSELGK